MIVAGFQLIIDGYNLLHAAGLAQKKYGQGELEQAREKLPELFGRSSGLDEQRREAEQDRLYQQIGRLQVEVDWLRKKSKALGLT